MNFQVYVQRSGGVAGMRRRIKIDPAQLPPETSALFEALLDEIRPWQVDEVLGFELLDNPTYDQFVYTILLIGDEGQRRSIRISGDVLEVGRQFGAFIDGIDFGERSGHSMYRDGKYFDMPPHREPAKKPKFKGAGRSES